MFGSAATFATQLLIARALEPQLYGKFATELLIINFIATLSGGATSTFLLHAHSKEGAGAKRWMRGATFYLATVQGLGIIFLLIIASIREGSLAMKIAAIVLIPHMIGQSVLDLTVTENQMSYKHFNVAFWQFFPPVIRLAVVGAITYLQPTKEQSLLIVSAAFSATGLTILFAGWKSVNQLFRGKDTFPQTRDSEEQKFYSGTTPTFRKAVESILPFGIGGILYLITIQGNLLLTAFLMSSTTAGIFNAALTISTALQQIPLILYQKYLLPKFHLLAHTDPGGLSEIHKKGARILLILGTIISLITCWLTPSFVSIFLGEAYQDSVPALQILCLSLPFRYMIAGTSSIILAIDINVKVRVLALVALINFSLLLPLICILGITGAAIATVLSDAIAFALFYRKAKNMAWVIPLLDRGCQK